MSHCSCVTSAVTLGLPPVVVAQRLPTLDVVESSMSRHSFEIGKLWFCVSLSHLLSIILPTHPILYVPFLNVCASLPHGLVRQYHPLPSPRLPHSLNPFIGWGRQCWVSWINLEWWIFPVITKREVNNKFVRGNVFQGEWTVRLPAREIGLPQLLYAVF